MKIKPLLFIVILGAGIYFTSCTSKSKKVIQQTAKTSTASGPDSLVIGNWFVGTIWDDNMAMMCNECPHIEFKRGGFAKIIRADNSFEYVGWQIKNGQTIVMTPNSTFRDSTYRMIFQKERSQTYLRLENRDTKSAYSLVK